MKNAIVGKKNRSRYSRRGTVLVLIAAALLLIVGFAAVAVDGSLLYMTRNTCQTTADAAALAAVSQLPDVTAAKALAQTYAGKNMPVTANGSVLLNTDIVPGHWNGSTRTFSANATPIDAMKVTIRRSTANNNPMSLMFAKGFGTGYQSADVIGSAVATFGTGKPWDVQIVQDVTSSFAEEIGYARTANQALLDCLKGHTNGDSLVGMSVFTGCGKLINPMKTIKTAYGSMTSSISNLKICGNANMPACSGTDIASGLETAVNHFATTPLSPGAIGQAIVLISDGVPNAAAGGCHAGKNNAQLQTLATQWADTAWARGISVFTVLYDEDNVPANAAFLASLARGSGIALQTPDPTKLPDLLLQVCATLPPKLVQ